VGCGLGDDAEVLAPPPVWLEAFDLVIEVYTLQVLPLDVRRTATDRLANLVAPGGTLLVICRGREPEENAGPMPWPLTRGELDRIVESGLQTVRFEDFRDDAGTRRFLGEYRKETRHAKRTWCRKALGSNCR